MENREPINWEHSLAMQRTTLTTCSLCKGPTDEAHEYTKGIYVCDSCAEEMEEFHAAQRPDDRLTTISGAFAGEPLGAEEDRKCAATH